MILREHIFLVLGLAAILALVGLFAMGISALAGTEGALAAVTEASGGDDDQPIRGEALEKCTAAALAEHPGGTVTETEIGDDDAYGVEVRLEDGSQVEVHLNKDCQVIGQETDDDGPNGD